MFWRLPFRPTSSLDTIISKDDVTLFQVLDDDDIIQEGKTQNPKLCDFISLPENLVGLVKLVTIFPSDTMEEKIRYKYPNIACELLCSNMGNISDFLVNEHFESLTSFLKINPPLNPLFSSFSCKILNFLCKNKPNDFFSNIRLQSDILHDLMRHIGTSSCMDLILQLVTTGEHQQLEFIRWLDENELIQSLVSVIRATSKPDICYNASQLLIEIQRVEKECCIDSIDTLIFIQVMESQEVIENILKNIFLDEDGPSRNIHLQCCISFLQGLLQPMRSVDQIIYPDLSLPIRLGNCNIGISPPVEGLHNSKEFPLSQGGIKVLNIISRHVFDFHSLLSESPEILFNGIPVLGYRRLVIIKLLTAILQVTPSHFQLRFISSGILKTLLDLFLKFPWNNFLHTQVEIIIRTLLSPFLKCNVDKISSDVNTYDLKFIGEEADATKDSQTSAELFKLFLNDGNIIEKILQCWETNQFSQMSNGRRMGYMGHLTNITNKVTEILESDRDLSRIFNECIQEESLRKWNILVSEDLPDLNFRNESKMGGDSLVPNFTPPEEDIQTDPVLNQAYTEYQLYSVATNFEDGFGVEDEIFYEEIASNPFSELDSFDFSLNSDEDRSFVQSYIDMCNDTIDLFNEHITIGGLVDSQQSSESDDWISHPIESNYNPSIHIGISDFDSDEDDDDEDHDSIIPEKIKSTLNDSNDMIETHIIYTQTVNNLPSQLNPLDVPPAILQKENFSHCNDMDNSSLNWPLGDGSEENTWAEFGPFSNISSETKSQGSSLNLELYNNLVDIKDISKCSDNNDVPIFNQNLEFVKIDSLDNVAVVEPEHPNEQVLSSRADTVTIQLESNSPPQSQLPSFSEKFLGDENKCEDVTPDLLQLNINNSNNCIELDVYDRTDRLEEDNFSFLNSLGLIHDYFSIPNLDSSPEDITQDSNSCTLPSTCLTIDEYHVSNSNTENISSVPSTGSNLTVAESRVLALQAHDEYLLITGQPKAP